MIVNQSNNNIDNNTTPPYQPTPTHTKKVTPAHYYEELDELYLESVAAGGKGNKRNKKNKEEEQPKTKGRWDKYKTPAR